MSSSVWSRRFVFAQTVAGTYHYTVPPQKIAVVKHVVLYNGHNAVMSAAYYLDNHAISSAALQVAQTVSLTNQHVVAGPAQTISIYIQHGNMTGIASGFLFEMGPDEVWPLPADEGGEWFEPEATPK